MKRLAPLFFLTFLLAGLQAQRVVEVPFGTAGLLFETIEGDTTATGERTDTNTIYQLASGTPYLINGVLEYSGYNLTIRAAPDADIPPMIVQSAADDDASGQLFRLRGGSNLTLQGLYLSGRATGGGTNDRIVRINTDDATVRIIDCTLDGPAQSAFRVQGDGARIFVENSVITRTGRPTDPTNGRFIDNRGVSIDTLVVTNSTIYNSTHYFYRNSGDGMIGYGLIDNNTFYNSGLDGFDFGPVREMTFTDNIVANCVFIGAEQDDGELDPRAQFAIDEALGELTDIVISNNNFYHEADLVNNLPDTSATGDTIVSLETIIFDSLSLAVIEAGGTAATNISEVLRFVNPPVLPTQFQDDWLSDTTSGSTVVSAMPWDMTGIDVYTPYTQNLGPDRFVVFHDFCYDGNSASATAGTDGGPIGDINAGCDPVSVTNHATAWGLRVYPNPTGGVVDLRLDAGAEVMLVSVFNTTGQLVLKRQLRAGQARLDLSAQPAGTYFLRLQNRLGNSAVRTIIKR